MKYDKEISRYMVLDLKRIFSDVVSRIESRSSRDLFARYSNLENFDGCLAKISCADYIWSTLETRKYEIESSFEILFKRKVRIDICRDDFSFSNKTNFSRQDEQEIEHHNTPPVYSHEDLGLFCEWHGLYCRSRPETYIAEELEKRGLTFFVNPGCRITVERVRKTREPDFMILLGGKIFILEVDGEEFHTNTLLDYQRDQAFEKNGLIVTRFTARQCLENPQKVIDYVIKLSRE
jgi:hypothetical protein